MTFLCIKCKIHKYTNTQIHLHITHYIYVMAASFFYIYVMATSFFYIHVMATSFIDIFIDIYFDIYIDILNTLTFTN